MSAHRPISTMHRRSLRWFLLLAPIFFLLVVNAFVAAFLEGVIYPGVTVAGVPVGGLTKQQALSKLQAQPLGRKLQIQVDGKTFSATNEQLGARYDVSATVDLAYTVGRQSALPLFGLWEARRHGNMEFAYNLDYKKLNNFTANVVREVGLPATNAAVVVQAGSVQVRPDKPGLSLDRVKVTQLVGQALAKAQDAQIELQTETVQASIQAQAVEPVKSSAQELLGRQIRLEYAGRVFTPSAVNIGYWLSVQPDNEVDPKTLVIDIDEQQVRGYVQSIANEINKNPVNRKVLVKNGVSTVEREGQDGLALDQEAAVRDILAAMRANRDATINLQANAVPYKTETMRTTGLDAAQYIEVNLSLQRLWAYQDGQVVYSSPVTSGATGAGFPTVTGTFAIYYKARNTYLNGRPYGYNYNVFVQYWMPFYSGYGLHDASWRSSFGGSDYFYGGSHGCVNLPLATAAFLYDWAPVGTPVWVHK